MRIEGKRDFIGYGHTPPQPDWPGGARVAVQFVLNYEEGGERCVLDGDGHAEIFLSEIINAQPFPARHMSMESLYEYGARAGVWRVLRLFDEFNVPLTIFGVTRALARNPLVVEKLLKRGDEICSHGYRWLDYQFIDPAIEREHIALAITEHERIVGERPLGWYTGRNSPNTRRLIVEAGGFAYDADAYDDDLPYWVAVDGTPHLVVPYTLDTNDMRFCTPQGFHTGEQFFTYARDAFDALYTEGSVAPKMLSIGLHCRIIGRPARIGGLRQLLAHIRKHDDVWCCRRIDIAKHWHQHFSPQ